MLASRHSYKFETTNIKNVDLRGLSGRNRRRGHGFRRGHAWWGNFWLVEEGSPVWHRKKKAPEIGLTLPRGKACLRGQLGY